MYRADDTNQEVEANNSNQELKHKTNQELDKFKPDQRGHHHHKLGRSSRAVAPSSFEGNSNWAPILQMVAAGTVPAGDSGQSAHDDKSKYLAWSDPNIH